MSLGEGGHRDSDHSSQLENEHPKGRDYASFILEPIVPRIMPAIFKAVKMFIDCINKKVFHLIKALTNI
jgi:hypothetical protein